MRIQTNINIVSERIKEKLAVISDKEYLLRPVCFDVIDLMTKRIHVDGKASDESQIGTYKKSYLKLRREKYKRNSDPKTIISLTRQLENDWSVIATPKGYGIGFLNSFNLQKARWTENTYKKKIFDLSETEREQAIETIRDLVRKALQ